MADKKEVKKRAIVEEISAEPEKETSAVDDTELKETKASETETENLQAASEKEVKEPKKEEQHTLVEAPAPPPAPMNDNKISLKLVVFLTAFVAVIVGGLIGGVIVFVNGNKSGDTNPTPTSDTSLESPTAETSAIPSATVDKSKYTINIQNGSGISGQGATVQKILTEAGFKVGTVGNAKTYDYTKTLIQVKSSVDKDFLAALDAMLAKTYVTDDTKTLPDSSTVDIVVIVGTEKAK